MKITTTYELECLDDLPEKIQYDLLNETFDICELHLWGREISLCNDMVQYNYKLKNNLKRLDIVDMIKDGIENLQFCDNSLTMLLNMKEAMLEATELIDLEVKKNKHTDRSS